MLPESAGAWCRATVVVEPSAVGRGGAAMVARACHLVGGVFLPLAWRSRPWRNRQASLPVSMMCARWVRRSTTAFASWGSGNTLVHSPSGRLVVTMINGVFVVFADHRKHQAGGAGGQRQVAEVVKADQLGAGVARHHASELPAGLGCLGCRSPVRRSVVNRTRRPCWQARTASAIARCVFPVPLSPSRITDSAPFFVPRCLARAPRLLPAGPSGCRRSESPAVV